MRGLWQSRGRAVACVLTLCLLPLVLDPGLHERAFRRLVGWGDPLEPVPSDGVAVGGAGALSPNRTNASLVPLEGVGGGGVAGTLSPNGSNASLAHTGDTGGGVGASASTPPPPNRSNASLLHTESTGGGGTLSLNWTNTSLSHNESVGDSSQNRSNASLLNNESVSGGGAGNSSSNRSNATLLHTVSAGGGGVAPPSQNWTNASLVHAEDGSSAITPNCSNTSRTVHGPPLPPSEWGHVPTIPRVDPYLHRRPPLNGSALHECAARKLARTTPGPDGPHTLVTRMRVSCLGGANASAVDCPGSGRHQDTPARLPRVLCIVYSHESGAAVQKQEAIMQTWGSRCDGFLVSSNGARAGRGVVNLTHAGAESYRNMWQKMRSTYMYLHTHYVDEFDWFYICGDDTWLAYENLRAYLTSEELARAARDAEIVLREKGGDSYRAQAASACGFADAFAKRGPPRAPSRVAPGEGWSAAELVSRPLIVGEWMDMDTVCGGGGYAINNAALRLFSRVWRGRFCAPERVSSVEDVLMSRCMLGNGAVVPDTRDAVGRNRFLRRAPWMYFKRWMFRVGAGCCVEETISFHNIPPAGLISMDKAVYAGC